MLMNELELTGRLASVTLPFLVTGFGCLHDAPVRAVGGARRADRGARIDGASTFRIFVSVVCRRCGRLRGARPVHVHGALERLPLAVLGAQRPQNPTVQVALSRRSGGYYADQALIMAGTCSPRCRWCGVRDCSAARSSAASWKVE
jgi:cellobiose transport system permease protein